MKNKKKILHVFPAYKIGGAPIAILDLIKNANHFYDFYTVAKLEDTDFFAKFEYSTKAAFDVNLTKFSLGNLIKILKIIKTIKPDILHAHGKGGGLYVFFVQILYCKKYKAFHTFHGFNFKKYNFLKAKLYLFFEYLLNKMVHYGIAVSPSEKQFYLQNTKVNPKKILTIPYGVCISPKKMPKAIQQKTAQYKINIVALSRISKQKDLKTMLQSFDKILSENVALHIMGGFMKGDVSYKTEIENLQLNLKNKDKIFFWGDVPNAAAYIAHFQIYWTTAIFEGLPVALLETMMSKTLIVATNCRGNIDLIEHQKTGFLTQMKNVKDNYEKIKAAIAILGTEKHEKILDNAYQKVQEFSMENHLKNFRKIYD